MRVAEIKDKAIGPGEREDLEPGLGQALIRVRAAGVNGADPVQVAQQTHDGSTYVVTYEGGSTVRVRRMHSTKDNQQAE